MGRGRRPLTLAAILLSIGLLTFASTPPPPRQPGGGGGLAPAVPVMVTAVAELPPPALPPVFLKTTGGPGVALTFDDGPDPHWTPRFLALLRKHKVKATFCVLGSLARAHPGLVRRIAVEGHTLCNHTTSHDLRLRKRSPRQVVADLRQTSTLIAKASGVTPKYFRAPGGNWSPMVVAVARQLGMKPLHWTCDPQDWRRPNAYQLVVSVRKNTRPGSIVLLHDAGGDRARTYAALITLLPELRRRFKLVPL